MSGVVKHHVRFISDYKLFAAMLMTRTRGVNVLFTPKKETRYVNIVCGFVPTREKVTKELTKVVEKNAIIPFLMEHKEQVLNAMQYKADRAIIVAALYNSAFPFSYEEVCILGKYFHVQDQVSRKLLEEKISEIYGFNKAISNAIDYSIPTLVEAGFIERPTTGIYTRPSLNATTEIALATYNESFFLNNPLLSRNNDYDESPYFEFVR